MMAYVIFCVAAYILRSGSAKIIEEKDWLGILKREVYEDIIAIWIDVELF